MGHMMQIMNALKSVKGALNAFTDSYPTLAAQRATVERIYSFWQACDTEADVLQNSTVSQGFCEPTDGMALDAKDITVTLPGGRVLWQMVGLQVQLGERVLLLGKDG